MGRPFKLKMATQAAEKLLRDEGLEALTVDPFEIAANRDIVVQAKPRTHDGVSGMLLRRGNSFGIVYATHIPSLGFQRFSVAHELGHYFLDGHLDQVLSKDGVHESRTGFATADVYELEADHFAAGLLMPSTPFKRELRRRAPGLDTINALAELCVTSRTATAIRCAQLTDHAMAVIVSSANQVDYCFMSEAMKSLPQLSWIRKGSPIPSGTLTAAYIADRARYEAGDADSDELDVRAWLGGIRRALVTEEVLSLGRYGKCLTVLSSGKIGQEEFDDDAEDEDQIIDRWTPRFRR
jgi:Zn-dependent peptidase ImmA (M78 family)